MNPIDDTVAKLIAARRSGVPAPATTPGDAAAAYAAQAGVARELGWFGPGCARHWKSGGPSRETATHAPLPPTGVVSSPADLRRFPLRLRGIEAEIALRLGEAVDAQRAATLNETTARALVDAMCVSIEVIDSRWNEGFDAPPLAKLADLQLHGALVLGEWQPFAERDWSVQLCVLHVGTQPPRSFRGAHSMGDPCAVLPAWLRHATRGGGVLAAGSVVTTGTWCGIARARAGDEVVVEFEGIGHARLHL